jgi:hypothetical protein
VATLHPGAGRYFCFAGKNLSFQSVFEIYRRGPKTAMAAINAAEQALRVKITPHGQMGWIADGRRMMRGRSRDRPDGGFACCAYPQGQPVAALGQQALNHF